MREVNRPFLVNEHGDLSIFSRYLSPVNASFLRSEYKQISIVETSVINGNVNFAATSEDKFVAPRALYVWDKMNCCRAFVLKQTVNCFLKSMQCFYWTLLINITFYVLPIFSATAKR